MNRNIKNIAAVVFFALLGTSAIAQVSQQKIGQNPLTINPNAALEIESSNKGLLLPRLALTSTDSFAPLTAHVQGMTVYNTAEKGSGETAVTPGYYYNDGTQWVRIATGADTKTHPWFIENSITEASLNDQNIYQKGDIGIGDFSTSSPTERLDILNSDNKGSIRIRAINSAAYAGNVATDKIVVADPSGVLKSIEASSLTPTTTNELSSATNTMTSVVNGISDSAPIVNSISNSISNGNISTTVNGVSSTPIAISNVLSSSVNTLSSTVADGTASTANIINTNTLALNATTNELTSSVNGVAGTVNLSGLNTNIYTHDGTLAANRT